MASAALGDEMSCSICLNLYTEPVSLRCGHNFCQGCIVTALDTQEGSGVYTCPECREESVELPTMEKNRKLCNIVENFRSTQVKEEKSEIFCTYCVDSPAAAIKTCVQCETSMCDKHLTAHNKAVDHVLMEPTMSFSSKKCSIHKKLLEYYCSEDAVCLCVSCCLVGKHKGHEVELLEDAFEKKKEKLRGVLGKLTMKREATEQKILNLQDHTREVQTKEDDEKKRVTALFEDFRRQLEVQEQKVLSEISRHREEISLSVIDLTKQLEIQKDELYRKICHIEKICNMTDPITALQDPGSDTDEVLQDQVSDTDKVLQAQVSDTDKFLQDQVSDTDKVLQDQVSDTDKVLQAQVSDTDKVLQDQVSDSVEVLQDLGSDTGDRNVEGASVRDLDDFMISLVLHKSITALITNMQLKCNFCIQDSPDLLLDEKTAHRAVTLSDDLRTASYSEIYKKKAKLPERFTKNEQVMSMESFSHGRHYWEVEVSDCGDWEVGVCYPSIERGGEESCIGCNNKSWSFCTYENSYKAMHDSQSQEGQPVARRQEHAERIGGGGCSERLSRLFPVKDRRSSAGSEGW
ncbi:PREDICTED: E3 ubiquitin/ISG15 ligase TRIM25-like [Nanorana parkeri]|uniref:E3 ubiquitin/ISG15 ligase TRIM25-like n=1 Tax=Nanorana parkeri TaxID=125878 RepID=UPI000854DA06|nr:PREDICTED: E3 ubiquitin/ISG15 ligase TRIM25-like [Nanorana parkeri]